MSHKITFPDTISSKRCNFVILTCTNFTFGSTRLTSYHQLLGYVLISYRRKFQFFQCDNGSDMDNNDDFDDDGDDYDNDGNDSSGQLEVMVMLGAVIIMNDD